VTAWKQKANNERRAYVMNEGNALRGPWNSVDYLLQTWRLPKLSGFNNIIASTNNLA
jgi:hypothetical protein